MAVSNLWEIHRDDDNQTWCENPHPVRLGRNAQHHREECNERRWAIDTGAKGYLCPGGEIHFYTCWFLMRGEEQYDDFFMNYREAKLCRDTLNAQEREAS